MTDVRKKLEGQFKEENIGRAVKRVFKGVIIKSGARTEEDWTKQTQEYIGIQWKDAAESEQTLREYKLSVNTNKKRKIEITGPVDSDLDGSKDECRSDHTYSDTLITLTQEDHNYHR